MMPRVLMIFGFPRSGSTVLGLLLQERMRAAFTGELSTFWSRYVGARPCSCGRPLSECPAWSAIAHGALGADGAPYRTSSEVAAVQARDADRLGDDDRVDYLRHLEELYRQISEVLGSPLVVDSSKGVGDAQLVQQLEGVDPRFLYLVRDPRGSAFSRSRARRRRIGAGRGGRSRIEKWDDFWLTMDGWSWNRMDSRATALLDSLPGDRGRTLRYEDFAARPEESLDSLAQWLSPVAAAPDPGGEAHVVGGNQGVLRTQRTAIEVRPDHRWQAELRPYKRRLIDAVTVRGRRRHGYH